MTNQEMVVLVDEKDNEVGFGEKLAVHREGKLHRAFSIFVLRRGSNDKVEVLLQQRDKNKYHCGELWTNTCCSHPRMNETTHDAAIRRLREEVGITTKVYPVGTFLYRAEFNNGLIEHELDHTFIGIYQSGKLNNINPDEIQDVKWISLDDLKEELKSNSKIFTPWLSKALVLVEKQQKFINALAAGDNNPESLLCLE